MKKFTAVVNGNEVEVIEYERTAEFNAINTIPENEIDELVTDGTNIYMWIDAIGEYKTII